MVVPLVGVLLVGLVAVPMLREHPATLYDMAIGAFGACLVLVVLALVARRHRPRAEPPSLERIRQWIDRAESKRSRSTGPPYST